MFHSSWSRSEFAKRIRHSRECRSIFLYGEWPTVSLHRRRVMFGNTSRLHRRQELESTEAAHQHQRSSLSSHKWPQPSSSSQHCSSRHQTTKCSDLFARSEESRSSFDLWLWIMQENECWKSFVFKAIGRYWNWGLDRARDDQRASNSKFCSAL